MSDFEENLRPDPTNVAAALKKLWTKSEPLEPGALRSLDLLGLPFLAGIPTVDAREAHLRTALRFVTEDLAPMQQVIYKMIFLEPTHAGNMEKRFARVAEQINKGLSDEATKLDGPNARKHGEAMLKLLAKILLSDQFREQLDDQFVIERKNGLQSKPLFPSDTHELLEYEWELDISDDDPRIHRERCKATVKMTLPHQRVLGLRYHTDRVPGRPAKDGVALADPKHTYLGTFPDPLEGAASKWWMHFIHLGRRQPLGAKVTVRTEERYFDEGEGESDIYLARLVRSRAQHSLKLGIRLPCNRLDEIEPKARIVRNPYDEGELVDEWRLPVGEDGWVRETFNDRLEVRMQYGIFLPNFDLYKK